jgi:hypothetical protein
VHSKVTATLTDAELWFSENETCFVDILFCQHHQHEAWWCKMKITPNVASCPTEVANLATGEAPLERSRLSQADAMVKVDVLAAERNVNCCSKQGVKSFVAPNGVRTNQVCEL